jgi:D,D-heptose 1,7-bisphosphate phosphatase
MPFLLMDHKSEQFVRFFRTYLEKEGYPLISGHVLGNGPGGLFQEIMAEPVSGYCTPGSDEYVIFDGRSIFDMDLSLFIRTSRSLDADVVAALNFSDSPEGKRPLGLEDDFSLFFRKDPEGQWVDRYENGGVYYFRKGAFDHIREMLSGSGDLLSHLMNSNMSFNPVIKGLPMGGRLWDRDDVLPCCSGKGLVQKRVPALFLDRDGVIIEDTGYVHGRDLKFIERLFPLVENANAENIPVVVVTNQSGVARGYFGEEDVDLTHSFIGSYLHERGLRIDRFYYCPYHMEGDEQGYRKRSLCRKPDPGMVLKACRDMDLDLSASLMIGDRERDRIKLPYLSFHLFH